MPRKKFNKEHADKLWKSYTANLIESITETEKEGLEKGYSSYEIEVLWQTKTKNRISNEVSEEENQAEDKK